MPVLHLMHVACAIGLDLSDWTQLIIPFIISTFRIVISLVAGVYVNFHTSHLYDMCFVAVVLQMSGHSADHYKVLMISANGASRGGDNIGSWGVSCLNDPSSCLFVTRSNPDFSFIV